MTLPPPADLTPRVYQIVRLVLLHRERIEAMERGRLEIHVGGGTVELKVHESLGSAVVSDAIQSASR